MTDDDTKFEQMAERMKHEADLQELQEEVNRLRRRVMDLEDFLRGAATQFSGMAGRQ